MHRSQGRKPSWLLRTLTVAIFALTPLTGSHAAAGPAIAEDGIVTLRGDPAAEAEEREALFVDLAKAANGAEATEISSKIWALWFRAPDAEAAALMTEALELRGARDYHAALTALDKLVEATPDWAEGWNQRATVRYVLRDFEGSLADIDRVLALEPKHFGALSGQALILMHQGKMEAGQLVLRKAVEIDPFLSERALIMGPAGRDI